MTRTRLLAVAGRLPLLVFLTGLVVFFITLVLQYLLNRPVVFDGVSPISAPLGPVALAGLCVAALTLLAWFVGAAILLGRQTRLHGAEYAHAYRLFDAQQFAEAIPLLELSIARGKESVPVLSLLARAYATLGQFSRAHRLLERAIDLHPGSAEPYAALGKIFLQEGNDEQAINALQAAVGLDSSAVRWAELGLAMGLAGRNVDALTALEQASQQPLPAPEAVRVYYRMMQLYTAAGNAKRAASAAAKMVSARDGLPAWESEADGLRGTGYGQRLNREIQDIDTALREADAARLA